MSARDIKDLCIAMEALSRIPGEEAVRLQSRIRDIVTDLIHRQENPPARTSRITGRPLEDEIPF